MANYLVRYSLGENNTYVYPESVAGMVWKSAIYHHTEQAMVGETDASPEVDGKQVVSLTPDEARKLAEEYQASYPKSKDLPDLLRMPRE